MNKKNEGGRIMMSKDETEIITIVMETDQGFNVYTGISAREVDRIGITTEPDLFTPDLYKAVVFVDEYMRSRDQRIVFVLGDAAGVHRQKEKPTCSIDIEYARRQGIGVRERGVEKVIKSPALAELCINIRGGQAVISPEGNIEFHDTGLNISLRDLKFVVQERI
jgi:hypothetical protein